MSLTPMERTWLENEARQTLGLTEVRARILLTVLEWPEPFSMRGIARHVSQSHENVRLTLDLMVARELLDLTRVVGSAHHPRAGFVAGPGRRLRLLLAALESGGLDLPQPA